MNPGLLSQLENYGNLFSGAVDAHAKEATMTAEDTSTTNSPMIRIDTASAPQTQPGSAVAAGRWKSAGAVLAVAAVFAAAIFGVTMLRGEQDVASPPFSDPIAGVESLTAFENTGDWEGYRASLGDNATILGPNPLVLPGAESQIEINFFFSYGTGASTEIRECTHIPATGGVDCLVTYNDDIGRALELEPVVVPRVFRIEDGQFAFVGDPELPNELPQTLVAFQQYVVDTGLQRELDTYFSDPAAWDEDSAYELGRSLVRAAEEFVNSR